MVSKYFLDLFDKKMDHKKKKKRRKYTTKNDVQNTLKSIIQVRVNFGYLLHYGLVIYQLVIITYLLVGGSEDKGNIGGM